MRAAAAEVEDYTRVTVLPMGDVELSGRAVGDVIHLLAELVENATSFSPPSTTVEVVGSPVASGYVLEIEDRGLGMTDAELIAANQRLATPAGADITVSRMMGFHVVSRLAARHGIGVQLRHSWYGGVTALVLLPDHLVAQDSGRPTLSPRRPGNGDRQRGSYPLAEVPGPAAVNGVYRPLRRHAAQPVRAGRGDPAEAGEPAE
jgi:hypothetical protein